MDVVRRLSRTLARRERLRQDVIEEIRFLRLRHRERALDVVRARLARGDLTSWGRLVAQRTAAALAREQRAPPAVTASRSFSHSYWRPPWPDDDPELY